VSQCDESMLVKYFGSRKFESADVYDVCTLLANVRSYGVQNTDVRTHQCAVRLEKCQQCHECDVEVSATLTEVFCSFPLFYQANTEVVRTYLQVTADNLPTSYSS
jgi:hypothetical protein